MTTREKKVEGYASKEEDCCPGQGAAAGRLGHPGPACRYGVGSAKGSGVPHKEKVGKLSKDQVREIATTKLPDLNANDIDAAMKIVEGTARSMGVTTE